MDDEGATAVEYGLLLAVSIVVAGAVFLLAPTLSFGLPEFAKFGLGSGGGEGGGGGGGSSAVVSGSGAKLAQEVESQVGGAATCNDYPKPTSGTVVGCTRQSDGAQFTVTWTSSKHYDVNKPAPNP